MSIAADNSILPESNLSMIMNNSAFSIISIFYPFLIKEYVLLRLYVCTMQFIFIFNLIVQQVNSVCTYVLLYIYKKQGFIMTNVTTNPPKIYFVFNLKLKLNSSS